MDRIANFLEEFACGFASAATIYSAIYYSQYKSTARNIENAPRITVGSDLKKKLHEASTIPYAIITGRVFPQDPAKRLETSLGMPAVISMKHTKEFRVTDPLDIGESISIRISQESDDKVSPALQYIPFSLSNPNTGSSTPPTGAVVMVDDIPNGIFDKLLVTSDTSYTPSEISFTGLVASLLRGFHSIGIETKEQVLPVGTIITVYGEVTKLSGEGYGFRVGKSPVGTDTAPYILTTKTAMEVASNYRMHAMIYKVVTMLCGSITVMAFYALAKKWLPRFRLRRVQQRLQRERANRAGDIDGLDETQICVACKMNPREVALLPCGHVCLCADCSLMINEKCPLCRETVAQTVAVYLS